MPQKQQAGRGGGLPLSSQHHCYRQVEPESAGFHSHVLDSCLEGSDVIPSGGKMCRHVPHMRCSTMWRS